MGTYLNPGNGGFARIANNEYVDKTGMIGLLNKAIGTTKNLTCKDDVLTLLIHLGYLTYEEVTDSYDDDEEDVLTGLAWIPNEEVRSEFDNTLRKAKHKSLNELVRKYNICEDYLPGHTRQGGETR